MMKRYEAYVSSPKIKGARFVNEVESENGTLCQWKDVEQIIQQRDKLLTRLIANHVHYHYSDLFIKKTGLQSHADCQDCQIIAEIEATK